jgi:hypothetical protein
MAFEPPSASRRRASTREKEKSVEREENKREKYESRDYILEEKVLEWDGLLDDDL